jgi:hypothetical protein
VISTPPSITQTGNASEDDQFWFMNGFGDSQANNLDDVMDMDLDLMLAQDDNVEDNATQTITWEQWDAWLADSNLIRPLLSDLRTST